MYTLTPRSTVDDKDEQIEKLKTYINRLVLQMNEKELRLKSLQQEYDKYVLDMD